MEDIVDTMIDIFKFIIIMIFALLILQAMGFPFILLNPVEGRPYAWIP
jgi:hypothetical protein